MIINCPICYETHGLKKLIICDNIYTTVLARYSDQSFIKNSFIKSNIIIENEFKCLKCLKSFTTKQSLEYHSLHNVCTKLIEFKCDGCLKKFASKQKLNYHMNNNVCGLLNLSNKTESIQPIQQNNTTNNSNNTTTNTSNTTNIGTLNNQNNVVINVNPIQEPIDMLPFRDVCYKIPTKKYLEYANNPDQAIKQFVKDYHLNPDKPERMNILNTNRRDNRVQLFDFDEDFICRWQTKDKSKVLELLCDRGVNALFFAKTMLTAAGIKLDPDKETKLNAKIKEYETSDKVKKKYVDMIGDLTYDYRDMVESNKKKYSNLIKN